MLLNNLKQFCERRKNYHEKFSGYLRLKEFSEDKEKEILEILSDTLMNPEYSRDVAECFPQLLLILLTISINSDKKISDAIDTNLVHKLNCTVIGKLILLHPDVLGFALQYFETNPAPFENPTNNLEPTKSKRYKLYALGEVSDFNIVEASFNILQASPDHFKYKWKWSKFYNYLTNENDQVKWIAIKCFGIVFEMSESLQFDCAKTLISDINKFVTNIKDDCINTALQVENSSLETERIAKNVESVVSVAGVLLTVFDKNLKYLKSDLISVPSMEENLRSLALAVASRKCICLQGAVGCGKTATVEYLAKITGHSHSNFVKVQLGDQTDSKMLLGTYRCTDIPGEFVWQPGVLTQAVVAGKWLLLEDIDSAALDVASVLSNLMETGTLSVPGYRDTIHIKSGFQLFVTQRLIPSTSGLYRQTCGPTSLLEKYWLCINMEPLSKEELITVVQTLFPSLSTVAIRMVDVFLLFSVGNHDNNVEDENTVLTTGRLISTRDLIKWCSRAVIDFVVSSPDSALKMFQDAIDIFCCSVANQEQRLSLATAIGDKLGIIRTKAEYFSQTHKPSITLTPDYFVAGRSKLKRKKIQNVEIEKFISKFSFTRPSACLLERITSCVAQKEPVLLVGETGTGKTSSIQYLARSTGHKLIVINMNQQSESADLLGGYKPVDLKYLIFPVREEFEILFRSYFAVEPNRKFLSHIGACYEKGKWKTLISLMNTSTNAALKRLRTKMTNINGEAKESNGMKSRVLLEKWERLAAKLEKLASQVKAQTSLAFAFIEGSLVQALREGYWVLLDEINLANAETLECLSGLLEGSSGSLSLLERGDQEAVQRHPDFTVFACMNPATDVGKKELPLGLRNRFTEFYIDELTERFDLQLLVGSYLEELNLPPNKLDAIVKFYLNVRKEATWSLFDGTSHKPHYSLRTLCRALSVAAANPCGIVLRSLYEAFCLSFLTQLDYKSYPIVQNMIVEALFDSKTAKAVIRSPIFKPRCGPNEDYIEFEGYWVIKGTAEPEIPKNYILTESVRRNLHDVVRVVSIGKMPVLLQGDTSVGKTSLIAYLAKTSGHICVRINNHEHTDLQEYVGSYVADESGRLVFKEGILVEAMRKGYWIILDELNLAPSDVLEALNRVLDDNRELFIPETQQTVKAHDNFMLFATQNPPGLYGGRKVLSRAFRNRFIELHFDEIPSNELQTILHERCSMPLSYCKQIIAVMADLQMRRKNTAAFAGKQGFITLRDLFRWGDRYRLAPDHSDKFYDWSQHLADEGYLVLASKVRKSEEADEIRQVIKKHLKRDVEPENLFTLSDKTSPVTKQILEEIEKKIPAEFGHVVWTYHMRRMAVLVKKSYQFKEPVLFVGETGGGKTTICQLIARMNEKKLYTVNCHMHTESSDFLGNLRPVRNYSDEENQKLFEWVDGPLINAMQNGDFFLADEISLADDSVLERLNSLLEPERSLLLSEKGVDVGEDSQDVDNTIVAHENFFFIGTMNPGGDYGKKELSPALRNRFTEIWCDGCTAREDLQAIIEHNLSKKIDDHKKELAKSILDFVEWLPISDVGKRFTVSIRDILSWVNFINVSIERDDKFKLNLVDAYYHGAFLTYIDSLGSGLTSMESIEKLKFFKSNACTFLKTQTEALSTENCMEFESQQLELSDDVFGISPFYISKGDKKEHEKLSFTFLAPTTQQNTMKLLRALQLQKPLLLEGSPGVGKTSLVVALAKASGHTCLRINLSDQTDVSDLFGADLPVEGGKGGEFAWRDGPFLRALRAGHWILLDELNLASQSVLEGLNACFDHRGEVFIPELGKTFTVKPETKLFACQNPLRQGGARRGLPKSFLNRFTQVFVDALTDEDLKFIAASQFSEIDKEVIGKMIEFNSRLSKEAGTEWGFYGAPWEMNLRDVSRWCEATIAAADTDIDDYTVYNPGNSVELIYANRMRTKDDRIKVKEIYKEIFSEEKYPILSSPVLHLTNENVYFGEVALPRTDTSIYSDQNLLILRDQLSTLRCLALCVEMNWMSILVGGSGCGKSSVVHVLAQLTGQKLKSIAVNSAMDTTEILGGFEQTDYNRHLEQLVERTENLLSHCLKTRVSKENICQMERYQALIETVRELSHDDCESVTMAMATSLFLKRINLLSDLLKEMKGSEHSFLAELEEIEVSLGKLKEYVEQEKCLNAGGKFEWVDSILVKCLREGTWLLIDQVNLCSPAVLDRLNGLLEPNGVLSIGERGVDTEGNVVSVVPHKNFRLFLTMDPKHGEISRAMRNRGVEIFMMSKSEDGETGKLDYRSLLHHSGLRKRNHQEALLSVHKRLLDEPSSVEGVNAVHLLHSAFLIVQQLSRGFPVLRAFESACADVYLRSRLISQRETRLRLGAVIENTVHEYAVEEGDEYALDLGAATCALRDLRDGSSLALVRQQALLLDWCARGQLWVARNASNAGNAGIAGNADDEDEEQLLKTDFINEFFDAQLPSIDVLKILPYAMLDFYEHSTPEDAWLRKIWLDKVFEEVPNLDHLKRKSASIAKEIKDFEFQGGDGTLPWDRNKVKNANNLALLLYFELFVVNEKLENGWKVDNKDKFISVAQFSQGHREGKMTIALKDQPLITNYVTFLLQVRKCIYNILRKSKSPINSSKYAALRQNLKWFSRFCRLGKTILLNKARKDSFEDLDEIILLLKVHYKWLKKFLKSLNEIDEGYTLDSEVKNDVDVLNATINEIDDSFLSVYDPFRKICKFYKKHMNTPMPCSSDIALNACFELQNLTDSFSPSRNRYISADLTNELKFVTLQTEEALKIRSELISLWHTIYSNQSLEQDIFEVLQSMNKFCETHLNISELTEGSDAAIELEKLTTKQIVNISSKIQLWPIHEYMFIVFIRTFQRKLCEKLINEEITHLPSVNLSDHHSNIPNIPVELFSILNTICTKQNNPEERNRLIWALIICFMKFSENSYAIKNFKQISHWRNATTESKNKSPLPVETRNSENQSNSPILLTLISELLLYKSQSASDKSPIDTGATLGSYSTRLKQLKTINDILWKNSIALNSNEFDQVDNDWKTLQALMQNFLRVCDKVELDSNLKAFLENDELTESMKTTILMEYTKPLEELRAVAKILSMENDNFVRGKAWSLLGYLQAFVLGHVGYIDPVHKITLKLRYIEEDIFDCENTVYVAILYSRILGLTDEHILHPRLSEIKNNLQNLKSEKNSLKNLNAVRPANTEFIALSKEFTNFRNALGSYTNLDKRMCQLIEVSQKLKDQVNEYNIHAAKTAAREAEIWLESIRRFIDQVNSRFASGYPDIVLPVLAGLTEMRHGVLILAEEVGRRVITAETDSPGLEQFLCDLVRFPNVGPNRENSLSLVQLCTSRSSRELIGSSINATEDRLVTLREQFRLTMVGLCELHNFVALNRRLSKHTWSQLNDLLHQVVLIWQQQQQELERREIENENLYKNKTKIQGESLTDEEQVIIELKSLFPTQRDKDFADVDENFTPSLEKKLETVDKVEVFSALITDNDIKEVQNIHSNIVKTFTTSEWLCKKANEMRPNFVEPLLQRYVTFGTMFENVAPVLSNELTGKLYTSFNVLVQSAARLGQGDPLTPEDCDSTGKRSKLYNYYTDSNVEEVKQCVPLLESILKKTLELLNEWPEHPTLMSIKTILLRIYSFPVTSSISRFLTGLELLLVKMHEWEENAHSGVSLQEYTLALTQQIISWRKLELDCWKDCLTTAQLRLRSDASKWWFHLYALFESYITENKTVAENSNINEPITAKKLIESLETFMTESSFVEYEARLELILTFHCHVYYIEPSEKKEELLAISWNVYNYYSQFLADINNRISTIKAPIESKLKDFVKIARWNDISYWSVKETVEKTHRTLHKFVKEFENGLKENVSLYLVVKPSYKNDNTGIWDRQTTTHDLAVDPDVYIVPTLPEATTEIPNVKSDLIVRANHYVTRAKKLCKEAILSSLYPGIRTSLEEFVDSHVEHTERLRAMDIDRTLAQSKQKSQAKSILQQKRLALSEYFKSLTRYGLSHRVGVLAWKNRIDEVLDFTVPPLELRAALENSAEVGAIEKRMLDQWNACQRYYYGSLIKLGALNRTLLTSKTDLGMQNVDWCKGFSIHLMLLANNQKKTLASVLKYFSSLRSQISDLSNMNIDDFAINKQKELQTSSINLTELLITAQTCFEQILIYLQACPCEIPTDVEDNSYSLITNNLPIINCTRGDAIWEKANGLIKDCLNIVCGILKKLEATFPVINTFSKDNGENENPVSIITSKHFILLTESFNSMKNVNENIHHFANMFNATDAGNHPLLQNILFLEEKITKVTSEFNKINVISENQMEVDTFLGESKLEKFENDLHKLINIILIVIQNKYKDTLPVEIDENMKNQENDDKVNEDTEDEDFENNKLREKLIESIETDIKTLQLKDVCEALYNLLKTISNADHTVATSYYRLLKKCLPFLQQFLLFAQFYVGEQVASFRLTCKILYLQLNVFLDLANNGFCMPKDLDLEEGEEGEEKSGQKGGMGLGDGEGQKDVSDKIETEDQLEEAKPAGQEQEKPEEKECPEEDKGLEVSEDFEGQLQDIEKKEDVEGEKDDNEEDLDKQMDETGKGADKLDEQIWGDDKDEPEAEETNKNEEELGDGEKTGEQEFGAKDERTTEDSDDKGNNEEESEKTEEQKEINEMAEPEYDEDQVNPYHGQHQPEPEPEPFDLPENMNVEEEDDMKDNEQNDEENPFDIDKMKESMDPPESKESETAETEEVKEDDVAKKEDSSDEEGETDKEKLGDKLEKEESKEEENEEETATETQESGKENSEKDEKPDEPEKESEDKATPSVDEASKETDAAEQMDEREGGSRDQIAGTDTEQESKEESTTAENWQDENRDKGTGQSEAEQHDAGHSGLSMERSTPMSNRDMEAKQTEKRTHPGERDEDHTLAEKIEPDKKKLKTMIHSEQKFLDEENQDEGAEQNAQSEPDICQHVKEKDKFDYYAMDAATEDQSKEQASNIEQEEETFANKDESMDVDMHEDEEVKVLEDQSTVKQNPEQASNEEKSKDKKDSKEKGKVEDGQLESTVDIEGEKTETSRVSRGADTAFFTNLTEVENELFSSQLIENRRFEVEKMLSQWTQVPSTEEAFVAWNTLSAVTDAPARDLAEKLRLVLEPTQASRLKGDYRTGRRINMRKIIPYIASQFRKDKIWLRRTKPSKRDYQIVLAIDDSSSMADNHSKELAFESLSLISKAMTYLEVGQLSVLSFGEETNILHPLGETFSERSGSRLMQEMTFDQKKTRIGQLVDFTVDMFQNHSNSSDNAKLLVVLSDGRGIYSEGTEKVNRAVRRARLADIFLVFIIVDNPINKDSILDIRTTLFQGGKLVGINSYMDSFPFPFYMILRDINALPGVLSDALRQWFEVVGKIDS